MWSLNSQLYQDLWEEFRGPLMTVHLKDRKLEYLPITPKLHWVKTVLKSSVYLNFQDSLSWRIKVSRAVKKNTEIEKRREEMSILEVGLGQHTKNCNWNHRWRFNKENNFFKSLKFIIERKKIKWIFCCCCSVVQPCPTLWGHMDCSIFTISWSCSDACPFSW